MDHRAATSATTSPDPEKFRDGWLRTGDVGTLSPDGFLTLTDRAKDVIKSGGEWISSVELENALMAHPAVLEACVVGVPDERWGERPLATVVLKEGASADADELRDFLGRHGGALAAAGALGVHRGGAEDQRRQVRQEGRPSALRRRRPARRAADLTATVSRGRRSSRGRRARPHGCQLSLVVIRTLPVTPSCTACCASAARSSG